MKKIILTLLAFLVLGSVFAVIEPAKADIAVQTKVKYYFQENSSPINDQVVFSIKCYGYPSPPPFEKKEPGTYTPEQVYSYSGSCSKYGCEINQDLYLNYVEIDYCGISGKYGEKDFAINNFGDYPINGSCNDIGAGSQTCTSNFNIINNTTEEPVLDVNDSQDTKKTLDEKDIPILDPLSEPDSKFDFMLDNEKIEKDQIIKPYILLFLWDLVLTIIIETLLLLILLKLIWRKKGNEIKSSNIIFTGIVASAITIPYLWFIFSQFLSGMWYIGVGEVVVVLVESLIIAWILKLKWPFALLLSLICNLASFLIGLLLMSIL